MGFNIQAISEVNVDEINQIQVISHYLKIPQTTILKCISTGEQINSPLRYDENPSFSFYIKNNKIKMRDFAGYFWGDIYDLVGFVNNIPVTYKNLPLIKKLINDVSEDDNQYQLETYKKVIKPLAYNVRKWNDIDVKVWRKAQLPLHYLIQTYVYPVKEAFYNNKIIYTYKDSDPCYAYFLGYVNDLPIIELYFPKRHKKGKYPKFMTNYSIIKGLYTLIECDNLIITKSNKDRLAIKYQLLLLHLDKEIEVIALPSESTYLNDVQYNFFKERYKNIVTLFDKDLTGIKALRYHRDKYNIQGVLTYHFFLRGSIKDFTELINYTNVSIYKQLFKLFLKQYFNVDIS